MAVNLQTVAMYQSQVDDKTELWSPINATNFNSRKQRIKDLIVALRNKEQQMLNFIAPNLTIETLRANVRKYHSAGLSLLSNNDVNNIVTTYKRTALKQNLITLKAFEQWLQSDDFQSHLSKHIHDGVLEDKGLERAILDIVNENIPQGEGRVQTHSRLSKLSARSGLNFTSAELLNTLGRKTQARILQRIHAESTKRTDIITSDPTEGSFSISVPVGVLDSTEYIDWYHLTEQGLKESEVKAAIAAGQLDEATLKTNFVNSLLTYISQKQSGLSQTKLTTILEYVINKDPMAPYVGLNEKGITGLLGEIQALCYLALLCGDHFQLNNQAINWAATQTTTTGQQFHADITLNEAYGVQVKNTTKDIVDQVNFNSASLDYILNSMCAEGYITALEKDIIIDIYTTYYFNQPYVNVDGTLVSGTNLDYAPTDDKVLSYVIIADKILTYLFDYFMYIGVGNAARNERGNLLYFLGGNSVVLASEICSAMLAQIDQLADFLIEKPDRGSSKIENIISFTNNNNLLKTKGDETFISNAASKVSALLHQTVSQQIVLTSSFDFTNLLTQIYN